MLSTIFPTCWRASLNKSQTESRKTVKHLAFALLAAVVAAGPALAQQSETSWPSRPIHLIVPFPPASTADVVARVLGQKLGQRLGQQFVVENRVGASGNIGAELIAKAAPDGYTIGIVTSSTQAVAATLSPSLPYEPIRDFTPIVLIASSPYVLVVHPGVPARSVAELIALARSKPGVLNYGSAGPASLAHLAGALFATMTDIQLTHVPYKSTAQSVIDMMSGRLEMQFATIPPSIQTIRAGKLRALAVTGKARVEALPDTPTMAEAGVGGYEATLWFALVAPAKFPAGAARRLNQEIADILQAADMKDLLAQQGLVAEGGAPEALTAQVRSDTAKWREVIGRVGITAAE
jgi:tripartite-type tricarboxylate transporter receptor subunit TctC